MTSPEETIRELRRELEKLRADLSALDTSALGDRRDREKYKTSLQGRVETLDTQVKKLEEDVGSFRSSLNKGITGFFFAIIGAAGIWVFNKLSGGP